MIPDQLPFYPDAITNIYQGVNRTFTPRLYKQNPDLQAIDNGRGLFTHGNNADVEMSEFIEFGKQILDESGEASARDVSVYQEVAAKKLAEILDNKDQDTQYRYAASYLARDVAYYFYKHGGERFFDAGHIPQEPAQPALTRAGYMFPKI